MYGCIYVCKSVGRCIISCQAKLNFRLILSFKIKQIIVYNIFWLNYINIRLNFPYSAKLDQIWFILVFRLNLITFG